MQKLNSYGEFPFNFVCSKEKADLIYQYDFDYHDNDHELFPALSFAGFLVTLGIIPYVLEHEVGISVKLEEKNNPRKIMIEYENSKFSYKTYMSTALIPFRIFFKKLRPPYNPEAHKVMSLMIVDKIFESIELSKEINKK